MFAQNAGEESVANLDYLYNDCKSGSPTAEWRLDLQRVMHNNAGVYRKQELLAEGCHKLDQLAQLALEMKENLKVSCLKVMPLDPFTMYFYCLA